MVICKQPHIGGEGAYKKPILPASSNSVSPASSWGTQRLVRASLPPPFPRENLTPSGLHPQYVPGKSQTLCFSIYQYQRTPRALSTPTRPLRSASGSRLRSVRPRTARSRSSPARTSPHRSRSASCASPRAGRASRPSSRSRRPHTLPRVNTSWRRVCPVRTPSHHHCVRHVG